MAVIGIDLGGTKLAGARFAADGSILQRRVLALDQRGGSEVSDLMTNMIHSLCPPDENIRAIGISVPGIANVREGTVWAPNIPGWDFYPLIAALKNRPELAQIPIVMDSDRACYILGEYWKGNARGSSNAIFLAVGTGIGAGIMIDGRILRGSRDIAGAVGWLALSRPYRAEYEACGDFEYHASGPGLVKVASDLLAADSSYQGQLRRPGAQLSTKHLFEAYEKGDPLAEKVLDQAVQYWGMAVANLVSIFNPEKIIFGGGVFGPATRFIDRIRQEARLWAQPISIGQVELEESALGGDAGLTGAGFLALNAV